MAKLHLPSVPDVPKGPVELPVLISIETSAPLGTAYIDPKTIVMVGPSFHQGTSGRPPKEGSPASFRRKQQEAMAGLQRCVYFTHGHRIFITDTGENMAKLGL